MILLMALMLFLLGTFFYYRAIVSVRENLNKIRSERGPSRKFFAVEELSLVSNPVRMYRFIFKGEDGMAGDADALLRSRKMFITSLTACAAGTALVGVHILLH